VVGIIPVLLGLATCLCTHNWSEEAGRRELRWKYGNRNLIFQKEIKPPPPLSQAEQQQPPSTDEMATVDRVDGEEERV
jgi:hypothetical protein